MRALLLSTFLLTLLGCESGVDSDCKEKPNDGRVCVQIYQPVCGCNGKTYGNSCEAEAYGITRYTNGECNRTN